MTVNRRSVTAGIGAFFLAGAVLAAGPPSGHRPPDLVLGPVGAMLQTLGLSEDQGRQVHELVRTALGGELGSAARETHEAHRALEILIWEPGSSAKDLLAAQRTLADKQEALGIARHALALRILGVLGEDQRADLAARLRMPPPPPPDPGSLPPAR